MGESRNPPSGRAPQGDKNADALLSTGDCTLDGQFGQMLAHLYRAGSFGYYWTVGPDEKKTTHWWPVGNPLPIPQADATYFSVHPSSVRKGWGERTTLKDIAAISCLFAEFDAKDFDGGKAAALAHVQDLEPSPSAIVDSGGGCHAYWLLREPFILATSTKRERARFLQREWVGFVGGDTGARDLARILRVPGTVNHKYDDRPVVTIVSADLERLYDLDDLEKAIPEQPRPQIPQTSFSDNGRDPYVQAALTAELAELARAQEGTRNHELNKAAHALGQFVGAGRLALGQVQQALLSTALHIGLSESEAQKTIRSGLDAGVREPRALEKPRTRVRRAVPEEPPESFFLTDMGNGARLVQQHGRDLRHCSVWNRWLAWDGARWREDDTKAVTRLAKNTVTVMFEEAAQIPDDDQRARMAKHAIKSQSAYSLRAMLQMASSEDMVVSRPVDFDQHPWLFNIQNGTVDLRSGELLAHQRANMITQLAPVDYDPGATCPRWDAFLARVMNGSAELIDFLRRAVGYGLTGKTYERCLFILHGGGDNGKSVFLKTLGALTGEYRKETPVSTLMIKRNVGIPNDLAALKSARIVTAAESEEGQRLAESLIKQMTGDDPIPARFLHAEYFEYVAQFKIWLATNHKPRIRGTDNAIWNRIRLVPFNVVIPLDEQDKGLSDKLAEELPGVLNWAIQGCLDWQREGLSAPAEVKKATQGYRDEMDHLALFLQECCIISETAMAQAGPLYRAYREWCTASGERGMLTNNRFSTRLLGRGFDKIKERHTFYLGLGLMTDDESE